jgi:hypothetical protein
MFNNSKEMQTIGKEMSKDRVNDNHSGFSYGYTIRQMEYIAKNGYESYKSTYRA